jgi:hypothetical protein
MPKTKRCPGCHEIKPVSEYHVIRSGKNMGQPQSHCKPCAVIRTREWNHKTGRQAPMSENKTCSSYLGVHIAEHVLSGMFDKVIKMPYGNPGYDFICGKGFKIDCKSSCIHNMKRNAHIWLFGTNHNTIADYFLFLAFDDREHLTPMHVWLVPSNLVIDKVGVCIGNSEKPLAKWADYEKPISKVLACCNVLKDG